MIEIDQKENPAEAGQVFMLGALYGQPLGGSGGTWGPSSRLNPYLVGQCPGSIPVLPRPRPATKHRDALAAPSTWGDRVGRGRGARRSKGLRAPLVISGMGRAALVVVSSGRYLAVQE